MKKYYIEFDTREAKGLIKATTVALGSEFIRDNNKKMAINLVDHPLYVKLEHYVLANPSGKK